MVICHSREAREACVWPCCWVYSILLGIVPPVFISRRFHPTHEIVPEGNIYSKNMKRRLTITKEAIHTNPSLTCFPVHLLGLGNWLTNCSLGVLGRDDAEEWQLRHRKKWRMWQEGRRKCLSSRHSHNSYRM